MFAFKRLSPSGVIGGTSFSFVPRTPRNPLLRSQKPERSWGSNVACASAIEELEISNAKARIKRLRLLVISSLSWFVGLEPQYFLAVRTSNLCDNAAGLAFHFRGIQERRNFHAGFERVPAEAFF